MCMCVCVHVYGVCMYVCVCVSECVCVCVCVLSAKRNTWMTCSTVPVASLQIQYKPCDSEVENK